MRRHRMWREGLSIQAFPAVFFIPASVKWVRARSVPLHRALVGLLLVGSLFTGGLLTGCSSSKAVKQADSLLERGRYTEALELYRQELERKPSQKKVIQRISDAKRLESERLAGMAAIRLSANDPGRAFELFADATRYNPDNAKATEGLLAAREQWMVRGEALEKSERPQEALSIYERILREYRGYEPCQAAIVRIQQAGANRHRQAALTYQQQNQPGNAVIELLKARRLSPELPGLDAEVKEAVAQLRSKAAIEVGVTSRAKSMLMSPAWALYLDARFAEARIPLKVVDGVEPKSLRIELFGTFSKVIRKIDKSTGTLEVPAGSISKPNPEYEAIKAQADAALARVRALETPLREAQFMLDALVEERKRRGGGTATLDEENQRKKVQEAARPHKAAMDEYQRISQQLAPLPASFQVPVTRKVSYPTQMATASISITGEILLLDREGRALETVPLREVLTESDETHPLLKATPERPEMPLDPVKLPDDAALRAKLEARVMGLVQKKIETAFTKQVATRWSDARRLAVAGKVDAASEMFLMALLADPRQAPDEAFRYIQETRQARGLPLQETLRPESADSQAVRREETP